jgi:hypothetical protein
MVSLHTKFDIPKPNGSVPIATKSKAEDNFCTATVFVF